jgi:hypothetical protein
MVTADELRTTLEDALFFHEHIDRIVRGPQQQHDLTVLRRYFRAYLHCWKTLLHFVRVAKHLEGRKNEQAWIAWCKRWFVRLNPAEIEVFEQLRKMRDYDTHQGMINVAGEVAAGLFPIVMIVAVGQAHSRRELISCIGTGLVLGDRLLRDYQTLP